MGLFPVSEQQAIPYRLNGKSDDFSDTFHSTVSCTLSSDDSDKKEIPACFENKRGLNFILLWQREQVEKGRKRPRRSFDHDTR